MAFTVLLLFQRQRKMVCATRVGFLILNYSAPADPYSAWEHTYASTPLAAHVSQVSANFKERRRKPQDFRLWDNWIVLKPVLSKWHKLTFLAWEMTSSLLFIYFTRPKLLLLPRHLKANCQKASVTIPSYWFPGRTQHPLWFSSRHVL